MATVWTAFLIVGLALLAIGIVGLRWKGQMAPVCRMVGRYLLVLAVATAVFPGLMGSLGPVRWAAAYIALVVVVTAVMTTTAVARARSLRS